MFGLIKKIFIALLTGLVNGSNNTKCVSLSNQKCETQPTLFNLHLDRCAGSCNTINDFSNEASVPNKTEDLKLGFFNMITIINESKKLTKHISCNGKRKFDETNIM